MRAALVGVAAGGLIGGLLCGVGFGVVSLELLLAGAVVALLAVIRLRQAGTMPPSPDVRADVPSAAEPDEAPRGESNLDRGVRDIHQTDPGFDPSRFAGYAAMVFRDTQDAWMSRDAGALRDRVTPELYGELAARCDRLRDTHQANRLERIEVVAEITEAWQQGGRDYVTAHIGGSLVDYTLDEVSDRLVAGSRTSPRRIEEFWTFTRPAGFNFWTLSAIQTS